MHISSRFNLLFLALIALASVCTARTTITIQKCSTRYCGANPGKIFRTTKTVHIKTPYTVTVWMTSTKYTSTHTLTSSKYITSTVTATLKTVTVTSWRTVTQTIDPTVTDTRFTTFVYFASGIVTPTYTVPAPEGFLAVDNDPDNSASPNYTPLAGGGRRIRREEGEAAVVVKGKIERRSPEPVATNVKYVTAVTCTKTLLTKTGRIDLWKTTTTTTGVTTTLVYNTVILTRTKTVTGKGALTRRSTFTTYKTVLGTSITFTIFANYTTTTSTIWSTAQVTATVLAACAPNNQAPDWYGNSQIAAYDADPYPDEKVVEIITAGDAYKCCELCYNYNGTGSCIGSVNTFRGPWFPAEDCPRELYPDAWDGERFKGWEWCPPDPDDNILCKLIIAEEDGAGTCRTHGYKYGSWNNHRPGNVSNGPKCARFKYEAPAPPP